MCGIISVKNLKGNQPVNDIIKILYQNQKNRGQQGFGFVGLKQGRIDVYRATLEKGIINDLNKHHYDEILFHHRLPTATENNLKSTHPFVIEMEGKKYYFMHNGIIQNAEKLQKQHQSKGIAYSSKQGKKFNDSEALGWDFCLWLSGKKRKISAKGSVAFVCLETDKKTNQPKRLYFYRNSGAPLRIYRDKTLFLIASEGNYSSAEKNWLYFWDYHKRQIRKYQFLKIKYPKLLAFNDYSYLNDEIDELDAVTISDKIMFLKQERDYLLSLGRYDEAETIDDEIDDLKYQLKEIKRYLTGKV